MSGLTAVSLFAGIGGIDRALEVAGIRVVAAVEIDAACRGILARHFPGAALFDDVETVTADDLRAAGFVPGRGILAAGWPCQGNSVAGRRGGMADPRSGLWLHVARLLAELRPRWFLGENVPGLYSVNDGRDIAVVRADLARLGYWWAERILDAQHFGVPQRRNRIFFAGHSGDRAAPVQVLLEPESGARNLAPGGQAGAGIARAAVVGTLQAGSDGRGYRIGAEDAAAGHLVAIPVQDDRVMKKAQNGGGIGQSGDPSYTLDTTGAQAVVTAYALTSRASRASREQDYVVVPVATRGRAGGSQMECGEPGDPAFTLRTCEGGSSLPMIAHALTSEGADASEDGTGRRIPIVPMGIPLQEVNGRTGRSADDPGHGIGIGDDGDPMFTLQAGKQHGVMAFNPQTGGSRARLGYGETPTALQASQVTAVGEPAAVRRLTPRECERLQGFPDEWTRWTADGREQSDSARYRQLGNAVAVPVAEWIASRIVATDAGMEAVT